MPVQNLPSAAEFPLRSRVGSPAATRDLAARAAHLLTGGEVLLLWGPLGAGKTCFVQGFCRELGVREEVTSPTFNLAMRYTGRLVVHHLDFYRLTPADDLVDVGVDAVLEEVADGGAVLVVEWPVPLLPWLGARLELLVLPGATEQERFWHLRGVPSLPPSWHDLLALEEPEC